MSFGASFIMLWWVLGWAEHSPRVALRRLQYNLAPRPPKTQKNEYETERGLLGRVFWFGKKVFRLLIVLPR